MSARWCRRYRKYREGVAEPLERAIGKKQQDLYESLLDEFSLKLDQVMNSLSGLATEDTKGQKEELDYSKIQIPQELIDELKSLVQMGDLMGLESNFPELKKVEPYGNQLVEILTSLVDSFDDQGILKVLDQLR